MPTLSLIPVRWWLTGGLIVSVILYHAYAVHSAVREQKHIDAALIIEANARVDAEHAERQAAITAQAATDNAALEVKLDSIKAQIERLKPNGKATVERIFPANCVAPKDKVDAVNADR